MGVYENAVSSVGGDEGSGDENELSRTEVDGCAEFVVWSYFRFH
jgi:hypothetical protein